MTKINRIPRGVILLWETRQIVSGHIPCLAHTGQDCIQLLLTKHSNTNQSQDEWALKVARECFHLIQAIGRCNCYHCL